MWLFIPLFTFQIYAADSVSTAIEQAQALVLKKSRQEAARVLSQAIDETKPPLKGRSRLIEALDTISKVFLSDKGQNLFESGQSTMFENPESALSQYKEALALEDGNILILDNIARIQLAKQDCTSAEATIQKARALDVYFAESAILELKALLCQKNFGSFHEKLKLLPPLDKGHDVFVENLQAQDWMQQKNFRKAIDVLTKASEEEAEFPETYYYLTKAGLELGRDTDAWAEKYVSLCKGLTPRARRRYSLEPRLCANQKEVADELAKKASDI